MTNILKKISGSFFCWKDFGNIPVTILFALCFHSHGNIYSQQLFPSQEVIDKTWESTSRNGDRVFVPHIQTVQFYLSGTPMTYPVMQIHGNSLLELHFDDVDSVQHNYSYSIEHFDALWQTPNPDINSFMDGFAINRIDNYEISGATSIPYRHYVLSIPNRDVVLKRTGNFLVKVFIDSPERPVITRRFSLYDNKIPVDASLRMTHLGSMKNNAHEITIQTDISRIQVGDIFSDLRVFIVPNYIWHQSVTDIKPLFVRGSSLTYEQSMTPGNEFRTLNLKEISENYSDVEQITIINGVQHIKLPVDHPRGTEKPKSRQDMNGRAFVEKFGAWEHNLDADYFYAYFTLKSELPMLDGNVYIYGALSNYSFNPWNLMIYNVDKAMYENRMLLKQGFHDYKYVHVTSHESRIDFERIEGNFAQTSNDYLIFVYNRDRATNLDELVGYTVVTSFP